jgi:hypothetical protein
VSLDAILGSLRYQRDGLTSPLYECLLGVAIDDVERDGVCAAVFAKTPPGVDPVLDALPLRFLGGIHRLVLDGRAPRLAPYFPSVGGHFDDNTSSDELASAFLGTVDECREDVALALGRGVQTNEVTRCAALLPGFLHVAAATRLPLRVLEIGASAGLNLRWDHYRYEGGAGGSSWGDERSPLRFSDVYADPRPDLAIDAVVAERRGCDRNPIDATTEDGGQLLRSFVWPDQVARFHALDAALAIADETPATVERADAGEWVVAQLAAPRAALATVFYQSIVWQYFTPQTRALIRESIRAAGARATHDAPLAWLRMEPGPDPKVGAEVRLSLWPDGFDGVLVRTGYHGRPASMAVRD